MEAGLIALIVFIVGDIIILIHLKRKKKKIIMKRNNLNYEKLTLP